MRGRRREDVSLKMGREAGLSLFLKDVINIKYRLKVSPIKTSTKNGVLRSELIPEGTVTL